MALNPYFSQGTRGEQDLVQNLINEQLRTYGVDVHYIPRKYLTKNTIIKEVIQSKFDDAYPIEAYVKSDSYEGAGILMSKFGVQAQEDITLVISKERWETYIQPLMKNESKVELSTRPKEGDLVYFPLDDRLYEIKFVERADPFYQLQKLYTYELRCEVFRYEDEVIDTNIDEIDDSTQDAGYSETLTLAGVGSTALATATFVNKGIRFISLTDQGQGYTYSPTVAISSSPGITATAVAITTSVIGFTTGLSIKEVLITNPGAGYTIPPSIAFVDGEGAGAATTVGIATTGGVGIVTITSGGAGYSIAPSITFTTPKHVGAAATAILDSPVVGGGVSVTSALISIGGSSFLFPGGTTGGVFYATAPTVTFDLPTGTGNAAEADATLDDLAQTGGTVETLGLTTGGKFYNSIPTVTFDHPGTSFAAATIGIAGSSINPGSIAFSTTGRAYTTAPTVAISTSGVMNAPTQVAVGIATIHPITGIVTAVSFNVSDSWATGTGATIGAGYTVAPSISFSGSPSPVRATASVTVSVAGTVSTISIGNSGFGYLTTPTVSIEFPGGADEQFRALGVATIRSTSIKTQGTIGIGSTSITGITTTNIIVGDRVRLGIGYSDLYNFIPADTFVTKIESNSILISNAATNVGIATSVFEFGRANCGVVTGIAVTFGGGGYLSPPNVTISNEVAEKNYINIPGISTATGKSYITSDGTVADIIILDAGYGYVLPPTITIGDPSLTGSGSFKFNEIVTGGTSGTQARVKEWNSLNSTLRVSIASGTFTYGETITGSESGAVYTLRTTNTDDLQDAFADNDIIQIESDDITDWTQRNPFGDV